MITNQTIDGVPRGLLERIADPYRREPRSIHLHNADIAELRALLDAPADFERDTVPVSAHWTDWSMVTLEIDGRHRTYIECGKPATQPQGEPVADLIRLDRSYRNGLMAGFQFGITGDEKGYAACIRRYNAGIQEAKGEQPAPVAVVLPESVELFRDILGWADSNTTWHEIEVRIRAHLDEVTRLNTK